MSRSTVRQWTNIASLLVLSAAGLLSIYTGFSVFAQLSSMAFLCLCLAISPTFGLREYVLAGMAFLLTFGLLQKTDGFTDVQLALNRAALFAAFIYLVTLLKEAAQRSPSVLALGRYLTRQAPGRRYYALAFGGHVMGVVLNFGAISLMSPLIQRGVADVSDTSRRAVLKQQQFTALIRGFSWMIMWSPTALTQVVLFTSFPQAKLSVVMTLGILASLCMILVGRLEDRWRWKGQLPEPHEPLELPQRAAIRFALICTLLIAGALFVAQVASVTPAIALMLVAPFLMCAWVIYQHWRLDGQIVVRHSAKTLSHIVASTADILGRSAITLGAAAYIGEAAAKLAPVGLLAEKMQSMHLPDWAFLMSLPVIITLCGQIALSPVMAVVFLATVIHQLPVLPADPSLIVFALGAGWALSMSASPNASATLLMSGVTGISPTTLTWRWNGRYALLCISLFFVSFYMLSHWF